ncbi:YoaK family protein [Blastococcus sp. PRF04-17]|uniref:YoaK family protein n=1 Tax=Blastococcus sp. PRF04-17 TaxID=2933797 RepID=UPI001FF6B488|nr:YoaK family protein [Blastococcus sp. PRF04-17]UOY01674.1 DUF1275 domain-containing protein [Blastococcus sp. PRF04-17]
MPGPPAPPPAATTAPTAGPGATEDRHHRRALRLRQSLVVTLAVVSGATDAIGLMALGGAFTSVMTGNLVILGVSASTADGELAIASGGAIVAFCAGAALGARLAGLPTPGDRVWPRPVTLALSVELVLLIGYAVGWWLTGARPGTVVALLLLFALAAALGIQSSTVQRFGVSGMSTTYLTGTLTTVVMRLATGRGVREVRHSIEILVGLVAGAAAGAGLLVLLPMAAPVLQLVALGAVVLLGATAFRRR